MNQQPTKEKIEAKNHKLQEDKSTWERSKANAKQIWGDLTEEDFSKANGSVEKLCGLIQERFGDPQEEIHTKLNKLTPSPKEFIVAKPTNEVADAVNEGLGWAQSRFSTLGVRVDRFMSSNRKKWGTFKSEMGAAFGAIGSAFKKLAD